MKLDYKQKMKIFCQGIKELDGVENLNRTFKSWYYGERMPSLSVLSDFVNELKLRYPDHEQAINKLVQDLVV